MSTTSPSWAGTASSNPPTCQEVLDSCDSALTAKKRELDLADLGIQIRHDEMTRLQKENAALRERDGAWYSNPMFWAAVGVIAGSWIGARATR